MTLGIQAGDGAQALDLNQLLSALDGFAVRTSVGGGCEVVKAGVSSVTVADGEVLFDGSVVTVNSQNVTVPDNTSTDPRKDVVFVDSNGNAQLSQGTPAAAKPSGQTGRDTFQPAPDDFASTDAVVLAEVFVPAGATAVDSSFISDRRVPSDFSLFDALVAGLSVSGTATVQDDVALEFGDGGDFAFRYDAGADAFRLRDAAAGTTLLETSGQSLVELTQGLDLPDDTAARLGGGDDFTVEYDAAGDQLVITDTAANETATFDAGDLTVNTLSAATVDGDAVEAGRVDLPDDSPLSLGATDDAQVRYDSATEEVVVEDTSTGDTLRFGAGTLAVDTVDATTVDTTEVLTDAVDLPDSGPVRFGDTDDVSIRYDDTLGAWVVSFGSDELRVLPDGTLRIDGQLETVGDADIGGDISFNGAFSPSDINADSVVSDAVDADVELSLPVFADNSNAVAEDSQVWFNDGSGPNAAGVYFYDSDVVGPLATGAGSAPASLSGLQIDTTKDFDGFRLEGLGHDEVDVPQTFDLVTDDFERASLGSEYVGDTQDAQIQSSVALEGSRSLEINRSSTGRSTVSYTGGTTPQQGDSFRYNAHLTDSNDLFGTGFLISDPTEVFGSNSLQIRLDASNDQIKVRSYVSGSLEKEDTTPADISNSLNETLTVSVEIATDRTTTVRLTDVNGAELGQVSHTLDSRVSDSGAVQYTVFNRNTPPTVYFDGPFIDRRVPQETRERQRGSTETSKLQTRGGVGAGPRILPQNRAAEIMSDQGITSALAAGTEVSYGLQLNGRKMLTIFGEADGSGGLQNPAVDFESRQLKDVSNNTTSDSMTANPETDTEDGFVEIELGGTAFQIPVYQA